MPEQVSEVVLAGVNARYTQSNLALRILRQVLAQEGVPAVLREYSINLPLLDVLEDLAALKPRVLLVSVYIWNAEYVQKLLAQVIQVLPGVKIFLGGPEVSYRSQEWLDRLPFVTGILQGAGEASVAALARAGFSAGPQRIIPPQPQPFAQVPFPYIPEDFPGLTGHYLYYESSRGCPFSCSYCLSSREDQALDLRPLDLVEQEIRQILAWHPPQEFTLKFVDRTFNLPADRARKLWQFLGSLDTQARFHFEVHPSSLGPQDFEILARVPAGRFQFELGIQSVHPQTLKTIQRSMDWDRARAAILELKKIPGLHLHGDLIAGLPGEGLAELKGSFDEVLALDLDQVQLGFLKIIPGTLLADQAEPGGLVHLSIPPYQVLSTPHMAFEDLALVRRIEHLVDSLWNGGSPFRSWIRDRARVLGSFWEVFLGLSRCAQSLGFDLHSRTPDKMRKFLEQAEKSSYI